MTQEERFEKWTFAQMEFITLRDAWHAALEPAELEWLPPDVNHVDENEGYELKWRANGLDGHYEIVLSMDEQQFEAWWLPKEKENSFELNDEYVTLPSIQECKQWCRDHYRRAAIEMINKLTGCTE